MARKRKKLQHLDYNSQEYWNKLLAQEGLSMDAGRNKKLGYIGGSGEVELLDQELLIKEMGRILPKQGAE